jgi:hypothetical protein
MAVISYIMHLPTRITTATSETCAFRFTITNADSEYLSDLFPSFSNATRHARTEDSEAIVKKSEHQKSHLLTSTSHQSSALAHSKRETASTILNNTITMAAKFAQNPAVHKDIQAVGDTVILIVQTLRVSGFLRLFPSFIHACLFVASESR